MATLKASIPSTSRVDADVTIELRQQRSGSVDVVAKGNGRKARLFRITSRNNRAGKQGVVIFGHKADALAALGFEVVNGRVAIAS
jgi:hypothetical protein